MFKKLIKKIGKHIPIIIFCWLLFPNPLHAGKSVLLEDDFSVDTNKWKVVRGEWEVINGEYVSDGGFGISVAGDEGWENYIFEVRMKTDEPGDKPWNVGMVIFRYNENGDHYYLLLHTNRTLELGKQQGGKHIPHLKVMPEIADPREWNSIRVEVKGANIKVYVNENLGGMAYTDENPIKKGMIGFRDNTSRGSRFDDVLVWMR